MKKYISLSLIFVSIPLSSIGWVFADGPSVANSQASQTPAPQEVIVTTEIPWAGCTCISTEAAPVDLAPDQAWPPRPPVVSCGNPDTRKFKCTIPTWWLVGFEKLFAEIIRVFVYITLLFGVLAIVALGIGYAVFSGGDEEKTKKIKNYAVNLIIGILILFFFRYILTFLAPWIFQ